MTFDEVAQHMEVIRCEACAGAYDHRKGARSGNTIHYADRTFTRAGLRHFLLLVAETRLLSKGKTEKWWRLWAYNAWAASVARKEFHITIPTKLTVADRAYVRWRLLTVTNAPAAARAWANKETTNG